MDGEAHGLGRRPRPTQLRPARGAHGLGDQMAPGARRAPHGLGDGDAIRGHGEHRTNPEGAAHQGGRTVHASTATQTRQVLDEEEGAGARGGLPGPSGPMTRVLRLAGGQGGQSERSTGDAGVQDEDRTAPGGELLGCKTGVVHRARQHGADVDGEHLVGALQGGGVGRRELGDAGPRGGRNRVVVDHVERHDPDTVAIGERRRQTGGGVGDDGEGHGTSLVAVRRAPPAQPAVAPAQRRRRAGDGPRPIRTRSTAGSPIRSAVPRLPAARPRAPPAPRASGTGVLSGAQDCWAIRMRRFSRPTICSKTSR